MPAPKVFLPLAVILRTLPRASHTGFLDGRHWSDALLSGAPHAKVRKLTRALDITRALNGANLTKGPLVVRRWEHEPETDVVTTTRIGITHCADWPLRYYIRANPYVSRK